MLLAIPHPACAQSFRPLTPSNKARPDTPVPFPQIRDWKSLKITLERGPCFGVCPAYKVEIDGDGNVVFEGGKFVAVTSGRDKIGVQAVRDLVAQFKKTQFFWLFDSYRGAVTDLPTTRVTIGFDGHTKQVTDYAGTMVGMPAEVTDLEGKIDAAAGTARWIKDGKSRP